MGRPFLWPRHPRSHRRSASLGLGERSRSFSGCALSLWPSLGATKVLPAPSSSWRFDQFFSGTTELRGSINGRLLGGGHLEPQGPQNTPAQGMVSFPRRLGRLLALVRVYGRAGGGRERVGGGVAPGRRTMK